MKPKNSFKRHKITLKMLADHLGVPVSTVYKWDENKKRTMLAGMEKMIRDGEIPDPRK